MLMVTADTTNKPRHQHREVRPPGITLKNTEWSIPARAEVTELNLPVSVEGEKANFFCFEVRDERAR